MPFDGRSDYVGFTDRGIPAGGVFAGAEGVKTPEEEAVYGGAAGSWYDPCYHQFCDNLITVFTGVPPLDAEGLAPEGDEAAKRAAQRKMAGGAIKSLDRAVGRGELCRLLLRSVEGPVRHQAAQAQRRLGAGTNGRAPATASRAKEIVRRAPPRRGGALPSC